MKISSLNTPKLILWCSVLLAIECIPEENIEQRIVGSDVAQPGEFPHMASLRRANSHFCGGSIINSRWVLTAAHCVSSILPSQMAVHVGTNYLNQPGTKYLVKKIISHPAYNAMAALFLSVDVALVQLDQDITFTPTVQRIKLSSNHVSSGFPATLSGWGVQSAYSKVPSNELKYLKYETTNQWLCRLMLFPTIVPHTEICVLASFGRGACFGDSGSPLVSNGVQIGIASRVIPCGVGMPDMYARVSYYLPWIKKIMENNK